VPNYIKIIEKNIILLEKTKNSIEYYKRLQKCANALPRDWRARVEKIIPQNYDYKSKVTSVWSGAIQNEVILAAMEQVSKEYVESLVRLSA